MNDGPLTSDDGNRLWEALRGMELRLASLEASPKTAEQNMETFAWLHDVLPKLRDQYAKLDALNKQMTALEAAQEKVPVSVSGTVLDILPIESPPTSTPPLPLKTSVDAAYQSSEPRQAWIRWRQGPCRSVALVAFEDGRIEYRIEDERSEHMQTVTFEDLGVLGRVLAGLMKPV